MSVSNEVFDTLINELQHYNVEEVAEVANVSASCIYAWLEGRTKSPLIKNVVAVAETIGLEVTISIE